MFREDDLLMIPAPMPVLSMELRSRVLAAALEAREKRSRGRRALSSALVFFALAGWAAWSAPTVMMARRTPALPAPSVGGSSGAGVIAAAVATPFYSRSATFIAAMGDDWGMVEAEFRLREKFTRRLPM